MVVLIASRNVLVRVASSLKQQNHRTPKKALRTGAFFVSVLWLLAAQAAGAQCPFLPGGFHAEVVHIYDGDTLQLGQGQRVRLIGINAPEIGRDGRPDQPGAREAARWLEQRVKGQKVYLLPGAERKDRYGRLLAHLYWQGELISEQMVRQGLGFALAAGSGDRLADCLFQAEQEARADAKGVWRGAPSPAGRIDQAGFAVIQGQVTGITPARKGQYIDLDNHLALWLSDTLVARFKWLRQGMRVEARGWVIDRLERNGRVSPGQQRWLLRVSAEHHLIRY